MDFRVLPARGRVPKQGTSTAYLKIDNWNDFSFITMFHLTVYDSEGEIHDIGSVKIGIVGQTRQVATYERLEDHFEQLPESFFSLGNRPDYYKAIYHLPREDKADLLQGLRDVVYDKTILEVAQEHEVFSTSLLRDVSLSEIRGQLTRVLDGDSENTDFDFVYIRPESERMSSARFEFEVVADSNPSTNIHAIIGRNGVGKTTILNDMIESIAQTKKSVSRLYTNSLFREEEPITSDFFSSLISVSFSAFDEFTPPPEQNDPSLGACYFYIGLKWFQSDEDNSDGAPEPGSHKSISDLNKEFVAALEDCFRLEDKKERWEKAILALESDENFAAMDLKRLSERKSYKRLALNLIKRMSAGHTIVLLTITKLVSKVEEKALLLFDEPESHLHPPLLSAFIRALSELLNSKNGVAIVATHSPVVLQEIPQSCVWKVSRTGLAQTSFRPDIETFGENVGVLTREVFGLEVSRSGFHRLLEEAVVKGASYEEILSELRGQLGYEGHAILRAMVNERELSNNDEED